MNIERTAMLGRLTETKKKRKEMEMKADGLITLIRMKLNPYDDLKKLPVEEVYQHVIELRGLKKKHENCLEEIEKLEEALGNG